MKLEVPWDTCVNTSELEEVIAHLLTPNAKAVADRLRRDHSLALSGIIAAAVDQEIMSLEEDVSDDGSLSDGENEQYFVRLAKRVVQGKKVDWHRTVSRKHIIGSKSYADMMKAVDARRKRRLARSGFSVLPPPVAA